MNLAQARSMILGAFALGGYAWASMSTPDGKQYVDIATSNARNRTAPQGTVYVAFSLP